MFHLITALTDGGMSFDYSANAPTTSAGSLIGYLLFTIIALRPVFAKAGYNGWTALIPIYNIYVLVKIGGFHGAFVILYLIPIVGWIFGIVLAVRIGKNFGKGGAFSFFLLWLLSFIGYCIIGYGSATYQGPARVKA
ncbi:MAG TPA: DUF5684 domain-containing protein [Pseudolysinimonas sp.]|jgi:hypothetical protein